MALTTRTSAIVYQKQNQNGFLSTNTHTMMFRVSIFFYQLTLLYVLQFFSAQEFTFSKSMFKLQQ